MHLAASSCIVQALRLVPMWQQRVSPSGCSSLSDRCLVAISQRPLSVRDRRHLDWPNKNYPSRQQARDGWVKRTAECPSELSLRALACLLTGTRSGNPVGRGSPVHEFSTLKGLQLADGAHRIAVKGGIKGV